MDIYRLLKTFGCIRSPRIKLLGLWGLHVTRRRYIGIFLDPVLSCNLRCRMCYFSDPERRKELHGSLTETEMQQIASALFHRALKLQIGCGAEPTLYRSLPWLVRLGKEYGIPYVSLTTNGQLLDIKSLHALAEAGLDELTLSLHGITQKTYEQLMQGARFDKFLSLLRTVKDIHMDFPQLKIRINYTLNADNVQELARFDEVFSEIPVNILQLRPIQKIGNTDYRNFSMQPLLDAYDDILLPLVEKCKQRGIVCLIPTRKNLLALTEQSGMKIKSPREQALENLTYCNITPGHIWQKDFHTAADTFESYTRRQHRASHILRLALGRHEPEQPVYERTQKLNYSIT